MSQPVDYTTYQEYMMASAQQYKKNGQTASQPQLYQAIGPVTNMVPGIFPIPIISMRPNADFDYTRYIAEANYGDQGFVTRPAVEVTNGTATLQLAHPSATVKQNNSRPSSPPLELSNSPRFGPGPPIVTSDRVKGPRGCNLFVFHLPNEITNWDLYLLFRRFGTILSVHTMVNKATGLSKGFGFVSYSAPQEATAAIAEMDGFRLGKKRLKVQLKRSQDDNPDDDMLELDENESGFYPAGNGHNQDERGGSATVTTTTTAVHNGVGGKGDVRSRQSSFNSSDSFDHYASGNTTRTNSPYGHHKGANGSRNGAGDNDYYHGVDSTNHSPTELSRDHVRDEVRVTTEGIANMRFPGGSNVGER